MTDIREQLQKLDPGQIIKLYDLDTTIIGGDDVYHFTNATISGSNVEFNSVTYYVIDCKIDEIEQNSVGVLPQPKITVANALLTFAAASETLNDLAGAKLTVKTTLVRYLDGQPDADPTQVIEDVFFVNRVAGMNKHTITWQLKSAVDVERKMLPRQYVGNRCLHKYRYYKDGDFVYTSATCPYTDPTYFTIYNTTTSGAADDKCLKNLDACRLRYPDATDVLPFNGFPGAGRVTKRYQ